VDHTLTGTFRLHRAFASRHTEETRDIIVYLPPGYNCCPDHCYPVLYMHDGQNLFDAATAFMNQEWGVDEVLEELIIKGHIEPVIVAGIYNSGQMRIKEYTHVSDRKAQGGKARSYGKLIVEELKPFIDSEYRTLSDKRNTGLGGSSLGGLVTLYLGLRYPDVFGKLIVMSPSVWWANRAIIKEVQKLKHKPDQKIWLDIGTCEGEQPAQCVKNVRDLRDVLTAKGWGPDNDLKFVEDQGAGHNEKAWGTRMRDALTYLFPASGA
jgi:predicted alpha/beta superfamily hydrolase